MCVTTMKNVSRYWERVERTQEMIEGKTDVENCQHSIHVRNSQKH